MYSKELATALDAAECAKKIISKHYKTDVKSWNKIDSSPVTEADIAVEEAIISKIKSVFPSHDFLGEEHGRSTGNSKELWIIDPIDGTKNFIRGIPLFGSQIALVSDGQIKVGVSCLPMMRETLFAEKGCGAYLGEMRLKVSDIDSTQKAHINYGGFNHFIKHGYSRQLQVSAAEAGRVRAIGDAYAYHLLATGRCEAVIEAKIKFWDIAALSLIITESGGQCTDICGENLDLNSTTVIASNGKIHSELVNYFRKND